MKTRQGVARRPAVLTLVGFASVLGMTAGLAFGLHQDAGQPTGQPSNTTSQPSASQPPASASPAVKFSDLVASFGGEKSFTRPWRDSVMGFSDPTRVAEILVAGGQAVTKDQMMIRGEDEEEVARLQLQQMRADSTLSVDKAKKALELATLMHERYKEADAQGGSAKLELERAKLDWEASLIDLDTAKLNQDQEVIAVKLAKSRLDRVHVVAPFDGVIDVVNVDVGQSVNENDKVIHIVDTSILWVDVGVPTGQTIELNLTEGGKAWALMSLPGDVKVFECKIVEVSPVADSSSGTRRIRVEIQNPNRIVAGVTTWVRFTEPGAEWASRIVPSPGSRGKTAAADAARLENSVAGEKR
ncbi:MAG: efflux RND transporter periplasmic adaptor subunit [Phycisphaerales bacterium]|nr:efflux RND transporter periplasmic adaptor subunit [Phycisphaerales bacterium]